MKKKIYDTYKYVIDIGLYRHNSDIPITPLDFDQFELLIERKGNLNILIGLRFDIISRVSPIPHINDIVKSYLDENFSKEDFPEIYV